MLCTRHQIFSDQINNNNMGGLVKRMGDRRGVYRVLVGKSEEKKPM